MFSGIFPSGRAAGRGEVEEQADVSIIITHNYGQVLEVCDRVSLVQGGKIAIDKHNDQTSAEGITEMVVAEYRKALENHRREAVTSQHLVRGRRAWPSRAAPAAVAVQRFVKILRRAS
jgi:ABC-type sugar transport system ATPase subunit